MRRFSVVLFFFCNLPVLWYATEAAAFADGPAINNAPPLKKLVVREVCRISDSQQKSHNGTLTFDGSELIVAEPHKKLSLFSVRDLQVRIVSVNPLIVHAWSDAATGGIFVLMDSEKEGNNGASKPSLKFLDLLYFDNRENLVNWKPKWVKKRLEHDNQKDWKELEIQWISGAQQFAMFRIAAKQEINFIDLNGYDVGKVKLPGPVFAGFDSSDNGIEAYYLSKDAPRAFVMRALVDPKKETLQRTEKLIQSNVTPNWHSFHDTRQIRLRGLNPGDVRRYVESTCNVALWQHRDHENIGLDPAHLETLRRRTNQGNQRLGGMGLLSYVESENEYEIVRGLYNPSPANGPFNFPSFLYRRSGDLMMLPDDCFAVDAVLSDKTWVVSLVRFQSDGRGKFESTFSLCTLAP